MTHIEENIINIAMRAGELLKEGKIQRDDISGHAGLTDTILSLAKHFEDIHAGIDFDAEDRDYWREIDECAETKLIEMYGIDQPMISSPLNLKVILDNGIVEGVLKDKDAPVQVEVLDIDEDYEDYAKLDAYRKEIYSDKSFIPCDYTVARFDEEPEFSDLAIDNVHVFAVSASVRNEIFCGDWDECVNFCVEHEWSFLDENEFQWDLEMVDDREASFPEDYRDAVDYYSFDCGAEIEDEYIRQHAEHLVICYQNKVEYRDFIAWNRFEYLLNETLSLEEACALSFGTEVDPFATSDYDAKDANELKAFLAGYRAADRKHPSLDTMIQFAANKASLDEQIADATRSTAHPTVYQPNPEQGRG